MLSISTDKKKIIFNFEGLGLNLGSFFKTHTENFIS